MTIRNRKVLLMCSLAVLLAAPLRAEPAGTLMAYIPFEFVAGNDTLPAGTYSIRSAGGFLKFASADSLYHSAVLPLAVNLPKGASESKLIFTRYGNDYFLHQVLNQTQGYGQQLTKSALELELAKSPSNRTELLLASQ